MRLARTCLAIVALALVVGAQAEALAEARAAEDRQADAFGCTVMPRKPALDNDAISAAVRVVCVTSLDSRVVVVELQQRLADGSYASIPGSRIIVEYPDGPSRDVLGGPQWRPVQCRPVIGTEAFRTIVRVGTADEDPTEMVSEPTQIAQDCFGGNLETYLSPQDEVLGAACETQPVSDEAVVAALDRARARAGTPVAASSGDALVGTPSAGARSMPDLSEGMPADPETISALLALESEFVDCYNAGKLKSVAALMAAPAQDVFLSEVSWAESVYRRRLETPWPMPVDSRISLIAVNDVRLNGQGRANARVTWNKKAAVRLYEYVDGEWRIVDQLRMPAQTDASDTNDLMAEIDSGG